MGGCFWGVWKTDPVELDRGGPRGVISNVTSVGYAGGTDETPELHKSR